MDKIKTIAANVCRIVLGLTFIFSGYVKASDPLGTQYKIHDYLAALDLAAYVPDWLTLCSSIALSAIEFSLGIFMLFAIRRRATSAVMLLFMVVMTATTVWIAIANPVSDCGCFGDAVVLSNMQTLAKNVVLLVCAATVYAWPMRMYRFISRPAQWIAINYTILFSLASSLLSLYLLPPFDFRPYHIGADLLKGMEIPADAPQPQFSTTFIMEKNGERKEFTLEDYPDSTWTFIDSKTVQTSEGYVPPIHDFSIQLEDGTDATNSILSHEGYTFLLISPHLETADDSNFGDIDRIYEYAKLHDIPFYCLTASTGKAIQHWQDITGAEYPFANTDETTLKTVIRSNPGLIMLRGPVVVGKWSHNALPDVDPQTPRIEQGGLDGNSRSDTSMAVVMILWFVVPLTLLTVADGVVRERGVRSEEF